MEKVRLDKWLWAARFFKTRTLASKAVKGGHVHVNGTRGKASAMVQVGDELSVTKAQQTFVVHILGLSDKRGPAPQAQQLYAETDASKTQREEQAEQRRLAFQNSGQPPRRPDKKQRRQIRRFKRDL